MALGPRGSQSKSSFMIISHLLYVHVWRVAWALATARLEPLIAGSGVVVLLSSIAFANCPMHTYCTLQAYHLVYCNIIFGRCALIGLISCHLPHFRCCCSCFFFHFMFAEQHGPLRGLASGGIRKCSMHGIAEFATFVCGPPRAVQSAA